MKSIIAASLLMSSPQPILPDFGAKPTVDLSAIRNIECAGGVYGTGFLIADNIMATALHIASLKGCYDKGTQTPLVTYHTEPKQDFALMHTSISGIPVLHYDCSRYVTGHNYSSYGYSEYLQYYRIFRQSNMVAYADYTGPGFKVSGHELPHMRHLYGPMVYGHSGGPILDTVTGNVVGMNNSGDTMFGLITGHAYSTELADTVLCKGDKE